MQVPAFELDEENIDSSRIKVMGDVFIIGYPLSRKETNNMFPIYKSGTIASEPEIHDAEPRFYVDSKTKPGMSGSPVVYVNTEPPYTDGSNIRIPKETITLIGVYAGRDGIATTEYEAELGRVWPIKECLLPLLK